MTSPLSFINKNEIPLLPPTQNIPGSFSENIDAGFESHYNNQRTISKLAIVSNLKAERDSKYEKLTGEKLTPELDDNYEKPTKKSFFDSVLEADPLRGQAFADDRFVDQVNKEEEAKSNIINRSKALNPELFKDILSDEEIELKAQDVARESSQRAASLLDAGGTGSLIAQFIGGAGASLFDPVTVPSMILGAPAGASIGKTIVTEAVVNAATEALSQPFIAKWQNEIGNEYGFNEAVNNIAAAALFGGGIAGVVKGARPALSAVLRSSSNLKIIPKKTRLQISKLAESVHVRENDPRGLNSSIREQAEHAATISNIEQKILRNEPIDPSDYVISEADFLKSPELVAQKKLGNVDGDLLNELRRITSDYELEQVLPKYNLNTLPNQVLKKVDNAISGKKKVRFEPEEIEMLKSAGVGVDKKSFSNNEGLKSEIRARKDNGALGNIKRTDRAHIDEFKALTRTNITRPSLKGVEPNIDNNYKSLVDDRNISASSILDDQKARSNPDFESSAETDFRRLAEENPDSLISLDDGSEKTISELLEGLERDQRVLEAISVCGVGK